MELWDVVIGPKDLSRGYNSDKREQQKEFKFFFKSKIGYF